jgi:ABC-type antimicrobial peptide transport system permease subunit
MALGAQQSNVVWMVLSEALWLGVIGSTIGISGALAIGRLVSSQLFGVQVADPLSIAAVSTVLIAVAGVAGYVPARRASHVDPMAALRHG